MMFKDRVFVVTGGGSGIGLQITKDLCREGAIVHILGRTLSKLKNAQKEIISKDEDARVKVHQCDVGDYKMVKKVFSEIKKASGSIYGLVNNAGINPSRNVITKTEKRDWDATIDSNLTGSFNCAKEVVGQMLELGKGSIVHISSVGGVAAFPYRTSYNASKFGLIGLSKSIAKDYAKYQIRSNVVCPGYIHTPLVEKFVENLSKEQFEKLKNSHAMRTIGTVEDISNATLFLLSDKAKWITGIVMPVDGGYLLGSGS